VKLENTVIPRSSNEEGTTTNMAIVSEIWRYPVKSVGGESLSSVEINEAGIAFDRGWSILDLGSGNNLTARRTPELLMASAHIDGNEVVITLPDGSQTADDAVLSAWLGTDVSLVRATISSRATFENPMDFENDADWMSWDGPPDAFHDSARNRISLVSAATMGEWASARFRINVTVEGTQARAEDSWVERTLKIADAELAVTKKIGRCVMVTRPQPGIERDLDVLRTINKSHAGDLGVASVPIGPATLTVGDQVQS
jgi:uncharacterized protein YcbX